MKRREHVYVISHLPELTAENALTVIYLTKKLKNASQLQNVKRMVEKLIAMDTVLALKMI